MFCKLINKCKNTDCLRQLRMLILLNDIAIFPIRRICIRFLTVGTQGGEFWSYTSFQAFFTKQKDRAFCENHAIPSFCWPRIKY